jgi:general secretion pathway protein D
VVSGPASLIAKIKADIARLDVPGPLIEVKAVSVECSSTADLVRELGLTVSGGTSETGFDLSEGELVYTSVGVLPEDFEVRLNALEESSKGKTNATSSISMLSGETGEIFAGTVKLVQLQVYSYSPEEQLEPISAGVKLNVTTWTGGGPITLAVKSEVSDIARDGARLPTINTRIAEGMLRLDPGETMMIGGLTERQVYKSVRKIPILGDLPIIGGLFRSKRRHVVETRLAVFLTPSILTQFASSERTISRSNMKPGVGM